MYVTLAAIEGYSHDNVAAVRLQPQEVGKTEIRADVTMVVF